jgi:AcrR family transcriptional regulator
MRKKQYRRKAKIREAPGIEMESPKQALTRTKIWNVSLDLFAQNGFEQTTVEEIATTAGVSRRTFFRHFESKSDLMSYAVMRYGTLLINAIQECPQGSSQPRLFRYIVGQVAQQTIGDSCMRKLMAIAATQRSAREAQLSGVSVLQDRITKALVERKLNPVTAAIVAELSLSALSMTYRIWYRSKDRSAASTVEYVLVTLAHLICENDSEP